MAGRTPWKDVRAELSPAQQERTAAKVRGMRVGMLIQGLREKAGLSQAALADRLGVTQQAISKIEYGDDIQISTLSRLCAALGGELYIHTSQGHLPVCGAELPESSVTER